MFTLTNSNSAPNRDRPSAKLLDDCSGSPTALAEEYGFEQHQRIYACPVSFEESYCSAPSFTEELLGDA